MIGYYAHSHGSGHCNYANLFAKVFGSSLTVFTDRGHVFDTGTEVVLLENEDPDGSEFDRKKFPEPRALHYAPVNISKISRRNRTILDTVIGRKISLMIIDVSVEIAMLSRVSSIPYAYVRLQGDRNDIPHLNAYEGASFLLAYFPKKMESRDTPPWIRNKTVYLGFLSKYMFGGAITERPQEFGSGDDPVLLHLTGFGGTQPVDFKNLTDRYDVYSIGPGRVFSKGSGIVHLGVVQSTRPYIEYADIVVAACGSNTTAEILSLGKRFVAVPEKRHYREQEWTAESLEGLGWAVDLSRHRNLDLAVSALENSTDSQLPKITLEHLKAFKNRLEFVGFKLDRFVTELNRLQADLFRRKDHQIRIR